MDGKNLHLGANGGILRGPPDKNDLGLGDGGSLLHLEITHEEAAVPLGQGCEHFLPFSLDIAISAGVSSLQDDLGHIGGNLEDQDPEFTRVEAGMAFNALG